MKRYFTEWKNIFTNDTSDKGLISKIYKELIQFNTKKQTNKQTIQLKIGQRTWIDTSPKRTKMANRHMKRCSTSLTIREMQIKIIMRYHFMPVRIAIINKQQVLARMWRNGNPCALLVGMQIGAATMENSTRVSQKVKNRTTTWPSNPTSGYLLEEIQNTNSKRYMHLYVHYSIIYNSQDMKAT